MESEKKFQLYSEQELATIAADPNNLVYQYKGKDRLPESDRVALVDVKDKVQRLYGVYSELRQRFIAKKGMVTQPIYMAIKRRLLQDPEWKALDTTHPLIFDRIVHPETTQKEIDVLLVMISLKTTRDTPAGAEQFRQHVLEQFSISPEEYERQKRTDGITSARA